MNAQIEKLLRDLAEWVGLSPRRRSRPLIERSVREVLRGERARIDPSVDGAEA